MQGSRSNCERLHPVTTVHFTLRVATNSLVQCGSANLLTWITGWSCAVAWINSPFPMYIPVCVIFSSDSPKNSRSPGCSSSCQLLYARTIPPAAGHRAAGSRPFVGTASV